MKLIYKLPILSLILNTPKIHSVQFPCDTCSPLDSWYDVTNPASSDPNDHACFKAHANDNQFYICDANGDPWTEDCPPGLVWRQEMLSCGFRTFKEILWSGSVLPIPYVNSDLPMDPCADFSKRFLEDHCVEYEKHQTNSMAIFEQARHSADNRHYFKIRGASDARIALCPSTVDTSAIGTLFPNNPFAINCLEIVLGWNNDQFTIVRSNLQLNGGPVDYTQASQNDMDPGAYIHYLIDASGPDMIVFKEGVLLFGVDNWRNVNINVQEITGVAIAGSGIDWRT